MKNKLYTGREKLEETGKSRKEENGGSCCRSWLDCWWCSVTNDNKFVQSQWFTAAVKAVT